MVEPRGIAESRGREAQLASLESPASSITQIGVSAVGAKPRSVDFGGGIGVLPYQDQGAISDAKKTWDEQFAITVDALVYPIKPGGRVIIHFTPDEGKWQGKKKEVGVEPNSALVGKCENSKDDPRNLKKKVHLNLKGNSLVSFKLLP